MWRRSLLSGVFKLPLHSARDFADPLAQHHVRAAAALVRVVAAAAGPRVSRVEAGPRLRVGGTRHRGPRGARRVNRGRATRTPAL